VETGDPFHRTAEPFMNPEPFTVRVNAGPPAVAETGFSDDTAAGAGAMMAKVTAFDSAARSSLW
jgi:hypothetical protein